MHFVLLILPLHDPNLFLRKFYIDEVFNYIIDSYCAYKN